MVLIYLGFISALYTLPENPTGFPDISKRLIEIDTLAKHVSKTLENKGLLADVNSKGTVEFSDNSDLPYKEQNIMNAHICAYPKYCSSRHTRHRDFDRHENEDLVTHC